MEMYSLHWIMEVEHHCETVGHKKGTRLLWWHTYCCVSEARGCVRKAGVRKSPDPETRIAALTAIVGRETNEPVNPIVAQGLSDQASEVREASLHLLRDSLDLVPIPSLASVTTQDVNPAFRIETMSLLVDQLGKAESSSLEDRDVLRAILQQGLADPDSQLREQATMLLENNEISLQFEV